MAATETKNDAKAQGKTTTLGGKPIATNCEFPGCAKPLPAHKIKRGRPRRYCDDECAQRDYARRHPRTPIDKGDA